MSEWLVFQVYRWIALPMTVQVLTLLRFFLPEKLRTMVEERRNIEKPSLSARPIWIHAASGEIEYAKPVIRGLKEKWPHIPILVTYFSPSAKKLIHHFPGVDALLPLPWDQRRALQKFLKFYQPRVCLIARTDAWPEMTFQLHLRKIPVLLFAATFSPASRRKGFMASLLTRWTFRHINEVQMVSREDQEEVKNWGVSTPVLVCGDTRYDQVLYRLKHPQPFKPLPRPEGVILVAGSTWPQDEDILLPAFSNFHRCGGRMILAPHEINETRIQSLIHRCEKWGYETLRVSTANQWTDEDILILDQMGNLQEVYTWGHLAFVGGSFKDRVHSVMEPLAAGLPVFVGPYYHNNREALLYKDIRLNGWGTALRVVKDENEVRDFLFKAHEFLKQPLQARTLREELQSSTLKRAGASQKVIQWVERELIK